MLESTDSRQRQKRLLDVLQSHNLDAIVLGLPHHVYYASGHRAFWLASSGFILLADGRAILISANGRDESAAVDENPTFEANWMGTQRQEQPTLVAEQMLAILTRHHVQRIGIDSSQATSQLMLQFDGSGESIDADLWQVRRGKFPDELALMRRAIDCTTAMYDRAREIIQPGLSEIELYAELHAAAVKSSGEPMTGLLGNDFACGVPGGPPRKDHFAKAGQLWILDLGPSYRGYFADNARVFSVDRKPTDLQMKAWNAILGVFPIVERMARPGVSCREIYSAAHDYLKTEYGKGLPHHLGHGVGLQPHEFPHLNLKWDDVLVEGEVFTVEPGIYAGELSGGIRLENQYLVTRDGVENLMAYPMDLV